MEGKLFQGLTKEWTKTNMLVSNKYCIKDTEFINTSYTYLSAIIILIIQTVVFFSFKLSVKRLSPLYACALCMSVLDCSVRCSVI